MSRHCNRTVFSLTNKYRIIEEGLERKSASQSNMPDQIRVAHYSQELLESSLSSSVTPQEPEPSWVYSVKVPLSVA